MNKKLYYTICISFLCAFFAICSVVLTFELKKSEETKKASDSGKSRSLYSFEKYNAEMPYVKADEAAGENKNSEKASVQKLSDEKIDHYFAISRGNDIVLYVIYESGKKEFKGSLGISTLTMRKKDKENFKDGVALKTREDVLNLIEDYTS